MFDEIKKPQESDDMEKKVSETIGTMLAMVGGALILYPLIDQAVKKIGPEIQKLTSGNALEGLKMLPAGQEPQQQQEKQEPEKQREPMEQPERRERPERYEEPEREKEEQPEREKREQEEPERKPRDC